MSDPIERLNTALGGRYSLERELGEDLGRGANGEASHLNLNHATLW